MKLGFFAKKTFKGNFDGKFWKQSSISIAGSSSFLQAIIQSQILTKLHRHFWQQTKFFISTSPCRISDWMFEARSQISTAKCESQNISAEMWTFVAFSKFSVTHVVLRKEWSFSRGENVQNLRYCIRDLASHLRSKKNGNLAQNVTKAGLVAGTVVAW